MAMMGSGIVEDTCKKRLKLQYMVSLEDVDLNSAKGVLVIWDQQKLQEFHEVGNTVQNFSENANVVLGCDR